MPMLSGISFKQTKCGGKLDADSASGCGGGVRDFQHLSRVTRYPIPSLYNFLFENHMCANPLDLRLNQQSVSVQDC